MLLFDYCVIESTTDIHANQSFYKLFKVSHLKNQTPKTEETCN